MKLILTSRPKWRCSVTDDLEQRPKRDDDEPEVVMEDKDRPHIVFIILFLGVLVLSIATVGPLLFK